MAGKTAIIRPPAHRLPGSTKDWRHLPYFCTYFDSAYLARGLALYRSLARHAQSFTLYVLCLDEAVERTLSAINDRRLVPVPLKNIEDAAMRAAKGNRTRLEYYFTCTPCWPLFLLNAHPEIDVLTYLDADVFFYSDPGAILDEMKDRSIQILPHRFPPWLKECERHGLFNVSILSFRNDEAARRCLARWRTQCLDWCYDRVDGPRCADQKYLDEWPALFGDRLSIIGHKGIGLAPWNIGAYEISTENGSIRVDGQELVAYHFHLLKVVSRCIVRTGVDSYGVSLNSAARNGIYAAYARELRAAAEAPGVSFVDDLRPRNAAHPTGLTALLQSHIFVLGSRSFELNLRGALRTLTGTGLSRGGQPAGRPRC